MHDRSPALAGFLLTIFTDFGSALLKERAGQYNARRDATLSHVDARTRSYVGINDDDALTIEHYHDTQDTVESLNSYLFTHDDYGQALAVLVQAGLANFAHSLVVLTEEKVAEDHMVHNT